jgi:hypothetical protein
MSVALLFADVDEMTRAFAACLYVGGANRHFDDVTDRLQRYCTASSACRDD